MCYDLRYSLMHVNVSVNKTDVYNCTPLVLTNAANITKETAASQRDVMEGTRTLLRYIQYHTMYHKHVVQILVLILQT